MKRVLLITCAAFLLGTVGYAALPRHGNTLVPIVDRGSGEIVGAATQSGDIVSMRPGYTAISPSTKADIEAGRAKKRQWKGTVVVPSPTTVGDELELQQQICSLLESNDPTVAAREQNFEWCLSMPAVTCTGWHCAIEKVTLNDQQGIIKLRVRPTLASGHPSTYTPDSWVEEWVYADGKLSFIQGYRLQSEPVQRILHFD